RPRKRFIGARAKEVRFARYVEDWRQEKLIEIPAIADRTVGPADAKVKLVVFGDYTEPNTGKVHQRIKDLIKGKSISYSFRHFPGAMACNPALAQLKKDLFVNGCLAARSAEAAGIVGGPDAFWKMTDWLFDNAAGLSQERVRAGALSMGLDAAKFDAAFAANGPADVAVQNQTMYAQSISVDRMPKIYVNGRWVRQWISDDQKDIVLDRIVADQLER
ncbi:MAG: thioredoxin domain-containing protein, partial [Phycisphaerales bacterium]|nr:thioredoxin domain-containing protein [Phycisphaerales bacterium]